MMLYQTQMENSYEQANIMKLITLVDEHSSDLVVEKLHTYICWLIEN